MRRSTALVLLSACLVLVPLSHVEIEAMDDTWLLRVDGRAVDVSGQLAGHWNRLMRDCRAIEHVPENAPLHARALEAVRQYSPPDSQSAQLRSLVRRSDWALAELRFSRLPDSVVLLRETPAGLDIEPRSVWSGTTHPLDTGSFIRRYLQKQVPEAPLELTRCFEPTP